MIQKMISVPTEKGEQMDDLKRWCEKGGKMEIGKVYQVTPVFMKGEYGTDPRKKLRGKCVYIHPRRRYCVLDFGDGVREGFWIEELAGKEE